MRLALRRALFVGLFTACVGAAQAADPIRIDISAQPLARALAEFAEQSGIKALYDAELLTGKSAPRVSGHLSPQQALEQLLAESGLQFRFVSDNAVRIETDKPAGPVDSGVQLPLVTVASRPLDGSFTSRSAEEARMMLGNTPSATTLIGEDTLREGAIATPKDAFSFAPGVIMRAGPGGEDNLSIRGASALNIDVTYGVRLLLDGLPITRADGTFALQNLDISSARHMEVYRGSAGQVYGSPTMGGAVNFVSYTGYDADRLRVRLEAGSFDYLKTQVSSGQVLGGGWDYYASLSTLQTDTFRDHSEEDTWRVSGNIGYRWNDRHESRLHLMVMESDRKWAGPLTYAQVKDDPTQAQLTAFGSLDFPLYDSALNHPMTRVALKHGIRFGRNDRVDFGIYHSSWKFDMPSPFSYVDSEWSDKGLSVRGEHHHTLGGRSNQLVWGVNAAESENDNVSSQSFPGGIKGDLIFAQNRKARNLQAYIRDQWSINEALDLVVGAQANTAKGSLRRVAPDGVTVLRNAEESYSGVSGSSGLVWHIGAERQLFANLSFSYEPPSGARFYDFGQNAKIEAQKATTFETGIRDRSEYLSWEAVVYHSVVKDEILATEIPPGSDNFSASNAAGDVHKSGIELGLEAQYPTNLIVSGDQIRFRLNYNYSRYRFHDDPSFGSNQVAPTPEQIGIGDLLYFHPAGFYLGPTIEIVSSAYADFANTLKVDGYTLLGFKAGYKHGDSLSFFVEGRNLTNENHVSSHEVVADAQGVDQELFYPGATRSVFAGMEYRY